ncbi:Ribosomal RNA large subunit methyltransferase K_L [Actinosynnema sp. ALI-1.44]
MRLLARTVRGVEAVAAREVAGVGVVESSGHREVWFSAVPGPAVLGLRCVDDVFLVAAVVDGIGRARADLRSLAKAMASVDVWGVVRTLADFGAERVWSAVDVSASSLGRRNFTRYDVEDAVGEPVAAVLGVPYHGRRGGRVPPAGGLSWRVALAGDRAVVGLRIAARPLHRRGYRRVSRPGALHPPVAAAMLRLAGLPARAGAGAGWRVVDPFCGTGTIAIEAAHLHATALGVDIDPAAIAAATANTPTAPPPIAPPPTAPPATPPVPAATAPAATPAAPPPAAAPPAAPQPAATSAAGPSARVGWVVGDAGRLPVAGGSVDLVVGNPPWGRQVAVRGAADRFWREVRRVLVPDGRAVLLVHDADLRGVPVVDRRPVSLFGAWPEIVTIAAGG